VHGIFRTHALYANGVHMIVSNEIPNGVRFEGSDGWIFVTRGNYRATASDPVPDENGVVPLSASDPKILHADMSKHAVKLPVSDDQHGNWIDSMLSREPPIAPVEIGHRSCSSCLLHHIAMKIDRHLHWDPGKERFIDDPEADAFLSRPHREPWVI